MDLDKLFPSKYLKAPDLRGHSIRVVILRVEVSRLFGGAEKGIAFFHGKSKGLILNRTQAVAIAEIAGSRRTEDWAGTSVILSPATVKGSNGAMVPTIRILAPPTKQPPAASAAPPAGSSAAPGDEFDSGPGAPLTAADIRF